MGQGSRQWSHSGFPEVPAPAPVQLGGFPALWGHRTFADPAGLASHEGPASDEGETHGSGL